MPRLLSAPPFRHAHDREIVRLAVPTFFALITEPLFLLTDSAVIGHLGTAPLGGLGVASQVLMTLANLCVFLAYGTTSAVARRFGAGDVTAGMRHGVDGMWLAVLLGAAIVAAGWPMAPWLVDWLGASPAVAPHALVYLRISLLSIPALLVIMAGTGVLRGLQDARTPLVVAVSANLANIVLCVTFVIGFGWGVAGSAWATVIAQTAGAAVYVAVVGRAARRHSVVLRPSLAGLRASATAGFALFVRTVSLRVVLLMTTAVAARLGDPEIAAHQVAFQLWSLLVFSMDAIAVAGQAIIGRQLGSADVAGTRAATRRMVEWGVMLGIVFAVLVLLVRPWAALPFTTDPQVAGLLSGVLLVVALLQPVSGVVMVLDGILMGAGDQRYLAWASFWTMLAFVPFGLLLPWAAERTAVPGLVGLWLAFGVWMLVRGLTLGLRARGGAWLVTGATRP
ncbi:MATE family efflux transporter [Marinitenerispora sediminis]|uniref:MATE family efflux transporter n=1 Tax=Marinitenerispora sediminis TaxID=1931232 RepID=A0A368T8U2_9ACTN|nr:MATE family efflux transporter [Marinitenerispora sediminis]RCV55464.1 MATE family efflux transporter [Marinitenerispora sediminis]RCV60798.1 MATE family efflux transporter [Marinitenerispora sediminis]RCV61760.1 MATE family efflux transporter [Marinitenerispora sediminis]